jgi:hypothetical protein
MVSCFGLAFCKEYTMPCRLTLVLVVLFMSAPLMAAPPATAAPTPPADTSVMVLDAYSPWRMHNTLKPPVIQMGNELKPVLAGYYLNHETTPPAADWFKPDFDDSAWARLPASRFSRTQTLAQLSLRGRFEVTDPAKVDALTLTVEFHGGAVVYLNGKELARESLAADAALAQAYSRDAYVGANGKLIDDRGARDEETRRRLALRTRAIRDVAIPRDRLVKGTNVLAIQIVRSAYDQVMEEQKPQGRYNLNWYVCTVESIRLRAASAAGLVPAAERPQGLQAWNADLLTGDFDFDFAGSAEPLHPVMLSGPRNGAFSGKIVVGSDQTIRGLRATAPDLAGPGGTIMANNIRLRYGMVWGEEAMTIHHVPQPFPYPRPVKLLGAMTDQPAAEYAVMTPAPSRSRDATAPVRPERPGAVVPVWITVSIPAMAKPGRYESTLTIQAEGAAAIKVPLVVTVIDWMLPDTQDYRTWVELIQSPDTLAVEYKAPLWSESHWALIRQSMAYCRDVGSRVVYVPLIAQNNLGNAESMVRWIKRSDGTYEYDFSIMDKYLDAATEVMGKPKMVIFEAWEVYMLREDKYKGEKISGQAANSLDYREKKGLMGGTGPVVTVLDRATGKVENVTLPDYTDAASKKLWQPLLSEVQKRMKARGLDAVSCLGTVSDWPPAKAEIAFFAEIAPAMPWVIHSHHGGSSLYGGLGKVLYQTRVWNCDFPDDDPAKSRLHGWNNRTLNANYQRNGDVDTFGCTTWHNLPEMCIGGNLSGLGRVGADFWPALLDKSGRRVGTVAQRYPQSSRRNLDLYSSLLAPGPDGPVATTRYEAFRQGIQECEARIAVDRALVDPALRAKLGDDLAQRCQDALDERNWCTIKGMAHLQLCGEGWLYAGWYNMEGPAGHAWYLGSLWQDRATKLFTLAGEVERKLAEK